MGQAAAGCGKTLDNADFVEGYEYPDEPVDVPGGEIEPDEIADNQVKVISFNMRTGGADNGTQNAWAIRCEGIPAMMEKENPTVMGVQEALGYQLSFVTDNVPGYDYYGVGRDDGGSSGETMAIFYKTDVVELGDHGTFWLSETPDKVSYGWDAKYRRTATWAFFTVKATGKRFFYVNTHLDNEGSEARKQSIVLICDKMKELNPNGAMMGGIVCTALDMSYGLLVFALCGGGVIPPTVSMTTNFINAIFGGDTLLVTAKVESWGKRIINMSAKGVSKNTGKTIVTSTTVYISNADFKLK